VLDGFWNGAYMKGMFRYPEFRLRGQNLKCYRAERLVFAGVDLVVGNGDALLLQGRNGSGKSSLLRLLAGLLTATSGELDWQGPDGGQGHLRYVGHAEALNLALSCRENLGFWGDLWGAAQGATDTALAHMALAAIADLPARFLSSGQRRRLALARLLLTPSPLWLLDEPTVGLDSASQAAITAAIDGHRQQGGAVVLATHVALDLAADCRVLSLDDFQPATSDVMAASLGDDW
jgi:heme exporter protein A